MQNLNDAFDHTTVDDLRSRLADWRREHKAPTPIPKELWAEAATLAIRQGVGPVARALKLDYAALKKKIHKPVPRMHNAASFLELLAPVTDTVQECTLDIRCGHGRQLRLEMRGVPMAGLAALVRELTG